MAKESTKDGRRRPQNAAALGFWQKIILVVTLLPFAVLFFPTVAVLGLGMLPTLGAYVADRDPQKHLTVAVGLLNFCGAVHPMLTLWEMGQGYGAMNLVIRDVYNWLVAYGAAGCGWLIYLLMPPLAGAYYRVATDARTHVLKAKKRKLIEIWGDEVSGDAEGREAMAGEGP